MTTQNVDAYWQRVTKAGTVCLPPDDNSHDLYLQIHTEQEECLARLYPFWKQGT